LKGVRDTFTSASDLIGTKGSSDGGIQKEFSEPESTRVSRRRYFSQSALKQTISNRKIVKNHIAQKTTEDVFLSFNISGRYSKSSVIQHVGVTKMLQFYCKGPDTRNVN